MADTAFTSQRSADGRSWIVRTLGHTLPALLAWWQVRGYGVLWRDWHASLLADLALKRHLGNEAGKAVADLAGNLTIGQGLAYSGYTKLLMAAAAMAGPPYHLDVGAIRRILRRRAAMPASLDASVMAGGGDG